MGAAQEAVRQAGLMMEKTKAAYEASMAAYDASSALRANVQVCFLHWLACCAGIVSGFEKICCFVRKMMSHPLGESLDVFAFNFP